MQKQYHLPTEATDHQTNVCFLAEQEFSDIPRAFYLTIQI